MSKIYRSEKIDQAISQLATDLKSYFNTEHLSEKEFLDFLGTVITEIITDMRYIDLFAGAICLADHTENNSQHSKESNEERNSLL